MSKRCVALLSAGLDSTIATILAQESQMQVELALTLNYGQRAAREEVTHAQAIAAHLGIPHRVLSLSWFSELKNTGALLKREGTLPTPQSHDLNNSHTASESAKAVWVPNRNGVFIEIAAAFAEDARADGIIVGFNHEEAVTFPDNSEDYLKAISNALAFSTSNGVRVISPTASLNKTQIVAHALRLNFPLKLLWSCYQPGDKMCGTCESCMRLKRALTKNACRLEELFADFSYT